MNRIDDLFTRKNGNILSVYFTAGYPLLNDTNTIIGALEKYGADMIEIGMPFSDPMADGPVIQQSNQQALANGMTIKLLFRQLSSIREKVSVPLLLMGYLNPVLQFGFEAFCSQAAAVGIDGLIIPDLPPDEYKKHYKMFVEKTDLRFIMLIAPQTNEARIREIDTDASGFIYAVSASSTTGVKAGFTTEQIAYFSRIATMRLRLPVLIGFGISDSATFQMACKYARGAIVGSAFVKQLAETKEDVEKCVKEFCLRIGRQ